MKNNYLMRVNPLFVSLNEKKYYTDYFVKYIGDKIEFDFMGSTLYLEEDNLFTTKIKVDDDFCKIFFEALILNKDKDKDNKENKERSVLYLHLSYYKVDMSKDFMEEVKGVVIAKPICFEHSSDGDSFITIDFKI